MPLERTRSAEPARGRFRAVVANWANVYCVTIRFRAWIFCRAKFSAWVPPSTLYFGVKSRVDLIMDMYAETASSMEVS